MFEKRRHLRIREQFSLNWKVNGESGEGASLNISVSGMQIVTDKVFKFSNTSVFFFEAPIGEELPFGPKQSKVVWFKRIHKNNAACYQCGLKFLDDAYDHQLKNWIDNKIAGLSEITDPNILQNYLA